VFVISEISLYRGWLSGFRYIGVRYYGIRYIGDFVIPRFVISGSVPYILLELWPKNIVLFSGEFIAKGFVVAGFH